MNYILKFRVWDEQSKIMSVPSSFSIFNGEDVNVFALTFTDKNGNWFCNAELPQNSMISGRFTLEQFTGLLDKNEKEIYEGDIVEALWTDSRMPLNKEEMKFDDKGRPQSIEIQRKESGYIKWGHAGWNIFYPNWLSEGCYKEPIQINLGWVDTWPSTLQVAVIGNIHENPELLK